MTHTVTVFHGQGCTLCDRALEELEPLRAELGFRLDTVDITGDEALEARHRAWLPVIEVDGERTCVYFVDEETLRARLADG